jgi:hypothetical protein
MILRVGAGFRWEVRRAWQARSGQAHCHKMTSKGGKTMGLMKAIFENDKFRDLPQVTGTRRNTAYAVKLLELAEILASPEAYLDTLPRLAR